jgi:hypothetical protein
MTNPTTWHQKQLPFSGGILWVPEKLSGKTYCAYYLPGVEEENTPTLP